MNINNIKDNSVISTPGPSFFTSTPKPNDNHRVDSSEDSCSDLSAEPIRPLTKQNTYKQYFVLGRHIFLDELKSLTSTSNISRDKYLSDSVLDLYPLIILKNEHPRLRNLNIYCAETWFLSFSDSIGQNCWLSTVEGKIPEQDVIIFPYYYSNHFVVIMVFRRQKIILYLDSLGGICVTPIMSIVQLFSMYSAFKHLSFNVNGWQIVVPEDIPRQANPYDCGMYVLMFIECCLTQNLEILSYHQNMTIYRNIVKNRIMSAIKNNETDPLEQKLYDPDYDKTEAKKFFDLQEHNLRDKPSIRIQKEIYSDNNDIIDTKLLLSTVLKNYWEENSNICNFSSCEGFQSGMMVLCELCEHWYHFKCENLNENDSLSTIAYKCKTCKER